MKSRLVGMICTIATVALAAGASAPREYFVSPSGDDAARLGAGLFTGEEFPSPEVSRPVK